MILAMMAIRRLATLATTPVEWESAAAGYSMMASTVPGVNSCLGNLRDCSANYAVLLPVLNSMVAAITIETPGIDLLSEKCKVFLELSNYPCQGNILGVAHRDAWGIKRCLTTLKRKWTRLEVPKDCCNKSHVAVEGSHDHSHRPLLLD